MTSSSEYPFGESAVARRLGHYSAQALMLEIAAAVFLGTQPIRQTPSGASLSVSLVVLVLATWLAMRLHDRSLCEYCVAEIPLDVEKAAARARWRFWLAHEGSRPHFVMPYFAVLIGTNFLHGEQGRLVWALAQSSMVYLVMATSTHRKLQPWCPWCRDDGGGEDRAPLDPPPPRDRDRELV